MKKPMTSRNPNSDDIYGSADVEAEWTSDMEADELSDATPPLRQGDRMKKPSKLAVSIDTSEYERNHGAKPRGRGNWMFIFAISREVLQAKMNDWHYLKHVWSAVNPQGGALSYSDAVKLAKVEAKERGLAWIGVCS